MTIEWSGDRIPSLKLERSEERLLAGSKNVGMKKANLAFGVVSLFLGIVLVSTTLSRSGLSLTLGMILGALLLGNGMVRLWVARGG